MIIQFILSLVIVLAIVFTIRRKRQHAIGWRESVVWVLLWLGIGVVIWRPDMTTSVAHLVGIGRGADLVLYAAIIAMLLMVFHLHVAHEQLERKLTLLVRAEAMKNLSPHETVANSQTRNQPTTLS